MYNRPQIQENLSNSNKTTKNPFDEFYQQLQMEKEIQKPDSSQQLNSGSNVSSEPAPNVSMQFYLMQ